MGDLLQQGPFALFFGFIVAHVIADFPLQGDYLARQKSRRLADSPTDWIVGLSAHCIIQSAGVWIISGSLLLAMVELVLHCLIDIGKGEEKFGLLTDQILHWLCKLAYVILLTTGVVVASS